jgi:hypothetical protein
MPSATEDLRGDDSNRHARVSEETEKMFFSAISAISAVNAH